MKESSAKVQALQSLLMFRGTPPSALAELASLGKIRSLGVGDVAMSQGEDATTALLILKGEMEAVVTSGSAERVVGTIRAGELVGETCLFTRGGKRSATVRASQPSRVMILGPRIMSANVNNAALVFLEIHMLGAMSRRIRNTNQTIQAFWDAAAPAPMRQPSGSKKGPKSMKDRLRAFFGGDE